MYRFTLPFLLLFCTFCYAGDAEKESPLERRHKIAPMMGYTYVFDVIDSKFGQKQANRLVPTFGLDYTYRVSPKFTLGLFNDLELGTYTITSIRTGEQLIRERVFVTAAVGMYEIFDRFSVLAGFGVEIEHHRNFFVTRVGADYEVPMTEFWSAGFGLTYDYKEDYRAIGFGVSFGRAF
jgi:hypothetical protein